MSSFPDFDRTDRRIAVLKAALELVVEAMPSWVTPHHAAEKVIEFADEFLEWLEAPVPVAYVEITADPPVERPAHPAEGPHMSLTFPDTKQDTLHARALDAEFEVVAGETFVWTIDVAEVATLTPSVDTTSCLVTPGTMPGAAMVSATTSDGASQAFAITITNGPVTTVEVTADEPVDRPASAPVA